MAEKKPGGDGDDDAKPATADDIMSPAEMKPMLTKAKRGTRISCVIGLTKDKDGLVLLDRKKEPKQLVMILKKQAAALGLELDRNSLRFGEATVDVEDDPKLIQFAVNKDAPGALRLKLLAVVKRAGYSNLEIGGGKG